MGIGSSESYYLGSKNSICVWCLHKSHAESLEHNINQIIGNNFLSKLPEKSLHDSQ